MLLHKSLLEPPKICQARLSNSIDRFSRDPSRYFLQLSILPSFCFMCPTFLPLCSDSIDIG